MCEILKSFLPLTALWNCVQSDEHSLNQVLFFLPDADVNAINEKSAVKLDGKTFLKFTNKMSKM